MAELHMLNFQNIFSTAFLPKLNKNRFFCQEYMAGLQVLSVKLSRDLNLHNLTNLIQSNRIKSGSFLNYFKVYNCNF